MPEPIAEGSYEWYRREVERLRAELANVQRGADTWKDAADGWEECAERLTAERDEQRQRAEQAEAAITRMRDLLPRSSVGRVYDYVLKADVLAALDASSAPESPCPRCEGSMIEPGSEDYDPAVHMHNPTTGEPCSACNGTGSAPETRMRPVSVESPGNDGFRYELTEPDTPERQPMKLTLPMDLHDPLCRRLMVDGRQVGLVTHDFGGWTAGLWPIADRRPRLPFGGETINQATLADLRYALRRRLDQGGSWWTADAPESPREDER